MTLFGKGTQPANVERDQDVNVTPRAIKKKGKGSAWTRFWKNGKLVLLALSLLKQEEPVQR